MKLATIAVAAALLAGGAEAAVINWSATLAPENEVPPVTVSDGSGSASGAVDTESGLLTWTIEWMGLTGPAIGLHFHAPATTETNAGVVVNISGTIGINNPSTGSFVLTQTEVQGVLSELWYINVHTEANPGGEIRGQVIPDVVPIPLPATLPMLLSAVLAGGAVLRRRSPARA